MLDAKIFKQCIAKICLLKNITINAQNSDALYMLMRYDFDNEEFTEISLKVCKYENLYNKYPDPCLFYKHKKRISDMRGDELINKLTELGEQYANHLTETKQ